LRENRDRFPVGPYLSPIPGTFATKKATSDPIPDGVFANWGVILGVRAQGVALSPNQPLNYRAQGFWPVTFGVDYTVNETVNYPDFRVRGAMGGL
jgi:hypothetical protein